MHRELDALVALDHDRLSLEDVARAQPSRPSEMTRDWIQHGDHGVQEGFLAAEMIDDHDTAAGLTDADHLAHHLYRIGHYRHYVEGRYIVKAFVGKVEVERVTLLQFDVAQLALADFLLRHLKHVRRGIDADHVHVRRIRIERDTGADPYFKHALIGTQLEAVDHGMFTVNEHP